MHQSIISRTKNVIMRAISQAKNVEIDNPANSWGNHKHRKGNISRLDGVERAVNIYFRTVAADLIIHIHGRKYSQHRSISSIYLEEL